MSNFNFEYTGDYLQYKDSQGNTLIVNGGIINETATGAVAEFTDGAENIPVKSLKVTMEPIQDLHGQDAPWPAGGGKNLLNLPNIASTTVNGVTYSVSNGVLTINGTCTDGFSVVNDSFILESAEYTASVRIVSGSTSGTNNSLNFYAADDTRKMVAFGISSYPVKTTFVADISKVILNINDGAVFTNAVLTFQLEKGSTATDFAPYSNICPISGRTEVNVWREATYDTSADPALTIQLGQTVYGGTVDVVSGEMVVDRAMVDLGTLSWSSPATNIFRTNDLASTIKQGTSPYAKLICSQYKTVQASNWASGTNDVITSHPSYSNGNVLVKDTAYTDAAVFKTAMDGVQLCYELATPLTIQLSAEQLTTVLGVNNVWSDADSVTVDYVADTKLYIQNAISDAVSTI